MSKKKYRRKQKKTFPIVPVAIGLFLIGFAILAMASPKTGSNAESLNSVVPMEVNYAAPGLSLQNINGGTESLADYLDRVVLVNNWATWCPPCKAEMPTLVAYHNEHKVDGFSVIAVEAGEPVELVTQFADDYQMTFPVWLDPNGESLRAFGNGTLPNSYVIDRSGTVRYAWTGEISKAMLEKYVTPLIAENN
ncbi:MAG TPA: TlpA disulfide reductase family protein [Anaerolineales bacterium]|nr:TlpA disulfide reductase family protein [Anaerolineales bacterium]